LLLLNNNHIIKDISKSTIVINKAKTLIILAFLFISYESYNKIKITPKRGINIKVESKI
jgi:hypothetical protein